MVLMILIGAVSIVFALVYPVLLLFFMLKPNVVAAFHFPAPPPVCQVRP
jgi:hypothetical protein